jgi:tRNA/rRNA methyltransferase
MPTAIPTVIPAAIPTRFILINTSHAGNVGAAARAMKTMGFDDLVLVAPRWANVLRREETIQRASGALDVLANARIVATLDEALDGMSHLCATAMTPRDFGPPTVTPREHFEALSKRELVTQQTRGPEAQNASNSAETGVAFLFGSERFGMRNDDVYRCHACLSIPSNPSFGSLNIGAALQVVAYEWRLALGGFAAPPARSEPTVRPEPVEGWQASTSSVRTEDGLARPVADLKADARQVAGMLAHLEQSLVSIGFLDPAAPKKLMPRLNQLFNRAGVTQEEIHILRGIAKMMNRSAAQAASVVPAKNQSDAADQAKS